MNVVALKYLLVLLVIYFTMATAILYGDASFVLLITTFSLFSFFYKKKLRDVYFLSFFANVVFGCIVIGVFQDRGSFFDVGGDDSKFYRIFTGTDQNIDFYLDSRYGHYILLGLKYVKGLEWLGIAPITPLLVYPLNWFIGANVCVGTYLLGQRFGLADTRAKVAAILLAIYPFFIFYEVKILRDILATLLLVSFLLIYTSKWRLLLKVLGILSVVAICTKVRGEVILYMFLFGAIDWFFKLFYSKRRYQALALALVGIMIVALGYNTLIGLAGREADNLDDLAGAYQELRSSDDSGSLGAQLKNAGPLFSPIIVLYMLLTPFPPPVLHEQNYYTLLISIGAVFWYFSYFRMPFFITSFYKKNLPFERKEIVSKLLAYILVCATVISLISADARHLIPFYPLLFILYAILKHEFPQRKAKYMKTIVGLGVIGIIVVYVFLKFL